MQFAKIRMQNAQPTSQKDKKTSKSAKQHVLTMEDLSSALKEYGVNAAKPDYYV